MAFTYVTKKEYSDLKVSLIESIKLIQNEFRNDYFTFQFNFIGSTKYNMITVGNPNKGFDFDINFCLVKNHKNFPPEKISTFFKNLFDDFIKENKTNYNFPESSKSVFTFKIKDFKNSKMFT